MRVQVPKSIFGDSGDDNLITKVKVGTCRPNESTADHLIFELDYNLCGLEQQVRKMSAVNSRIRHLVTTGFEFATIVRTGSDLVPEFLLGSFQ